MEWRFFFSPARAWRGSRGFRLPRAFSRRLRKSRSRGFLRAHVVGEVTNAGFERGFGDAHDVVIGDDFFGAVVGEGDDGAAVFHEGSARFGDRDQAVGADVERDAEAFARGFDETAIEIFAVGEGERMNHNVETCPIERWTLSKSASICASSPTLQGSMISAFTLSASGRTRRSKSFAQIVECELGASFVQLSAMAQPRLRSLATPRMSAFFPSNGLRKFWDWTSCFFKRFGRRGARFNCERE